MLGRPWLTISTSLPGARRQVRRDGAVAVEHVVRHARQRDRIERRRDRLQHRLGVRHADQVGQHAAVLDARERLHAVVRERRHASRRARSDRRAQVAQRPQLTWKETTTRWPIATAGARRRRAPSTSPTHSWPSAKGPRSGKKPEVRKRSMSQRATASGRTSASPSPREARRRARRAIRAGSASTQVSCRMPRCWPVAAQRGQTLISHPRLRRGASASASRSTSQSRSAVMRAVAEVLGPADEVVGLARAHASAEGAAEPALARAGARTGSASTARRPVPTRRR